MTSLTTKKMSFMVAEQFREGFYEPNPTIGYVFIGNHIPYANNDANIISLIDSTSDEKTIWDNMYAAKKITGNDVEFVVPRVNWTANTKYKQYDDKIEIEELLTGNVALNVKPMYVYTKSGSVYKCLSNNNSSNSTVEPSGDYTSSNGNISTTDGFIWKYMYNVKPSNRFISDDWLPAPTSTRQYDYSVNNNGVLDGELTTVVVTSSGSGYYDNDISVDAFLDACTILTLSNTTNVAANMAVSGTGILPGAYIRTVDTPNNLITLSSPTIADGGGTSANQLTIRTRIYFDGDGANTAEATPVYNGNTISAVTITKIGVGYSRANAYVYGTGTNANLRCIISPKYGHAHNPAIELGGTNIMVAMKIGEIDSTENGKVPANTTFRQYGIFVDPHKYEDANVVSPVNANVVISQTTDLSLVAGSSYILGELVYQGVDITTANTKAYGYVIEQTSSVARITNVKGTFTFGLPLKGYSSATERQVISVSTPEFQPYSGDIIHVENAAKTTRVDGQAENIKMIVKF